MNYIKKWFHFYETTDSFLVHKRQGFISPDSICFIKQTGQLYAQGSLFGICSERYNTLEQLVYTHDAKMKDILGIEGPSVDDGAINNLSDIIKFLDGFTDQDNLKECISAVQRALEDQISEVNRVLTGRIESLTNSISTITSDISAINTRLGDHDTTLNSLRTDLANHITQYDTLKNSYDKFKEYAETKFGSIDNNIEAFSASLGNLQQEFTNLDRDFSILQNNIQTLNTTIDNLKAEHNEMRDKLGANLAAFEQFKRDVNIEIADFEATVGMPDGIAPLDSNSKVPAEYLPSYVDDVLEYATKAAFPTIGESGKIYVSLDDNITYRWSGSAYIEISKSLALGETISTAYPGSKGKKNAEDIANHILDRNNPHNVTKAQLGLDKVNNTSDLDKPVSTAMSRALDDKVDKVTGKGLSTNDYTNVDKQRVSNSVSRVNITSNELVKYTPEYSGESVYLTDLGKYVYWDGTEWKDYGISESNLEDVLSNKADRNELSNVLAEQIIDTPLLEEIETLTREEIKKDLFIDQWNTACGTFGQYNEETGFFELNGLTDITYDEALEILGADVYHGEYCNQFYYTKKIRTNIPPTSSGSGSTLDGTFYGCHQIEVAYANGSLSVNCFVNCNNLKSVIGAIKSLGNGIHKTFVSCPSLQEVKAPIINNGTYDLSSSPLLQIDSFQYMVGHKTASGSVNIIVHPDVYAKLMDESNTEWHKVMTDALEKNISFVTT